MNRLARVRPTSLRLHHYASTPNLPIRLSRWLAGFLVAFVLALIFAPWQQSVDGGGRVVAYSPTEREQDLHAPVSGRIVEWHVVEGSIVKEGDPIAEMIDIDPMYLERIEEQLRADSDRIAAAEARIKVYGDQAESYQKAREMKVQAMQLKVQMAQQKLEVAKQKAEVAEAQLETAGLNRDRVKDLTAKGINSQRQLEVAELGYAKAQAAFKLSQAEVVEAKANRMAAAAEVSAADAEGGAKVAKAQAEVGKAESEAAYAKGDISKLKVQRSRQLAQTIVSPVDGTVVAIDGILGGGVVKEGQHLAKIVPATASRAVEVFVNGNDAPLISKGRKVRLQFEGWPALQFVGWPGIAVGTYGGEVSFVDPAATDGQGRVRVLVVPDKDDVPWPDQSILRQQVRARSWFLLDTVTLGWEVWRQLNGFPPTLDGRPTADPQGKPEKPLSVALRGERQEVKWIAAIFTSLTLSLPGAAWADTLVLSEVLNGVRADHPLAVAADADIAEADAWALSSRGAFDLKVEAEGMYSPLGKYSTPYGSAGLKQPTTLAGLELWTKYQNGADFAPYDGARVTSEWGKVSVGLLLPLLQGRAIDPERLKRYVADTKADMAREKRRQTQAKLLKAAAEAWWDWLIAGKKLEAYEELVVQAKRRQEFIRQQVESGAVSRVELEDNERVLAQRQARLAEMQFSFAAKGLSLGLYRRNARGAPLPPQPGELPALPHLSPDAGPPGAVPQGDLELTPRMKVYDLALRILKREADGADNDMLPRLDLELMGAQSFGETRPYTEIDSSVTETSAGGRLTFAWDVQRRKARGRKAALGARYRAVEQERRLFLDSARLKLTAQMTNLAAQLTAAQLSQKATKHAEKVAEAEQTSFQLGQSSVLAVNLREQAYLSTYISELEAIRRFQVAWIAQQELLGRTAPADYMPPRLPKQEALAALPVETRPLGDAGPPAVAPEGSTPEDSSAPRDGATAPVSDGVTPAPAP